MKKKNVFALALAAALALHLIEHIPSLFIIDRTVVTDKIRIIAGKIHRRQTVVSCENTISEAPKSCSDRNALQGRTAGKSRVFNAFHTVRDRYALQIITI